MFEQNIKHGTLRGYNVEGCRCDFCKKAKSDQRKRSPITTHGTKWGYDKGCRCEECKKAKAEYWHKQHPNAKPPTTDIEKGTRKCITCQEIKKLEDFPKNRREFLGINYSCKGCHNQKGRDNKNKPNQRFSVYKTGARVRNLSFVLSLEEFMSFWNKPCYYCGTEIDGIGLDRKDPSIGYILDNIAPCCFQCNRAKMIQTSDQFIQMCLKVAEKFKNCIVPPKV